MKIQTKDLIGHPLDWAVAKANGKQATQIKAGGPVHLFRSIGYEPTPFTPSTDPAQAYLITHRANITTIRADDDYEVDAQGFTTDVRIPQWFAECDRWTGHSINTSYEGEHMAPCFIIDEAGGYYGTTPLIAAMRAWVGFKIGPEVDVPEELLA